jgi:hypothetical protein
VRPALGTPRRDSLATLVTQIGASPVAARWKRSESDAAGGIISIV